jgi:MFS transporter, FSR family, fosmidomycin resistance protein
MTATTLPHQQQNSTTYAVLFAAAGCHMINDTLQAVMLSSYPLLRDTFTLTFAQIGLITMVFQVTASILQPLIGLYTDKKPLPYILPVAPAMTLIGFLLLALAPSYAMILIAAGIIGIGSSIFHPDSSRVARLASGGRFGFAQATFQVGGNVGTAIGPLLAATIVLPYGQSSFAWFAILAIASIMILSGVGRWYSNHLEQRKSVPTTSKASPFSNRTIIVALTLLVLLMFSKFVYTSSLHSFYTFYLIDHFGVTQSNAQICLFILLGAIAVGTFAGGPIGDRIGTKKVILFSILGALPFTLALPHMNLFWTVALTIPIGLIISSAFSAMVVYAQELLPGRVGMISGLFFGLAFGMGGMGAAVLGRIADATSIDYVFQICAFLPALGLLAFLLPERKTIS